MITSQDSLQMASAIRAARSSLDWSQHTLAAKAGISLPTVARIEAGMINPKMATVGSIFRALEDAGVSFNWTTSGFTYVMSVKLPKKRGNA